MQKTAKRCHFSKNINFIRLLSYAKLSIFGNPCLNDGGHCFSWLGLWTKTWFWCHCVKRDSGSQRIKHLTFFQSISLSFRAGWVHLPQAICLLKLQRFLKKLDIHTNFFYSIFCLCKMPRLLITDVMLRFSLLKPRYLFSEHIGREVVSSLTEINDLLPER